MLPTTLSIISTTFHGRERATAFGAWGATVGVGVALGPVIGGFLTTNYTWRWAFGINVIVAPLAIHLPLRALGADTASRAARVGLVAFYVVIGIAAVGHAATWDPFRVIDCAPVCRPGDNIFVVRVDVGERVCHRGLVTATGPARATRGWRAPPT